jgi:hypothetical protein
VASQAPQQDHLQVRNSRSVSAGAKMLIMPVEKGTTP